MEFPPNPTLRVRQSAAKGEEVVVVWPPLKDKDKEKEKEKEKGPDRRPQYNLQSLSSVLNDPTSPTPSKTWNPNGLKIYPSPFVPHVEPKDFDKYLEEMTPDFHKFKGNHEFIDTDKNPNEPSERTFPVPKKPEKVESNALDQIPRVYFEENFRLSDPDTFDAVCQTSGNTTSPTFLQDKLSPLLSPALTSMQLSHYLDVVEVELVKQVGTRSDSFFEALTNIQDLHDEVKTACNQIGTIRQHIQRIDEESVQRAVQIAKWRKRRKNMSLVYKKLQLINKVKQAQPTIQILLSSSDFAGALDLISRTQHILTTELNGVQSLKHMGMQLKEMANMVQKMIQENFVSLALGEEADSDRYPSYRESENLYEIGLEERLLPLMIGMLRMGRIRQALQTYRERTQKVLKRSFSKALEGALSSSAEGSLMAIDKQIQNLEVDRLVEIMEPILKLLLAKLERVAFVHNLLISVLTAGKKSGHSLSFEEESISINREREKENEPREKAPITRGRSQSTLERQHKAPSRAITSPVLGRNSQSRHPPKAMQVTEQEISNSEEDDAEDEAFIADRLEETHGSGLDKWMQRVNLEITEEYRNQVINDSTDMLNSVTELTHVRCARLLKMRTDVNAKLITSEFVQVFNLIMNFILKGESLCRKQCYGLRGTLLMQAKAFLDNFHSKGMASMALILENETWNQAEIAPEFQSIASDLIAPLNEGIFEGLKTPPSKELHSSHPNIPVAGVERIEKSKRSNSLESRIPPRLNQAGGSNGSNAMNGENKNESEKQEGKEKEKETQSETNASPSKEEPQQQPKEKPKREVEEKATMGKALDINGRPFHVVNAALLLLKTLSDYINVLSLLPALNTDIIPKMVEVMSMFNSRTCGLVLGAGAMQVANLRSITAKHLALAAECIGLQIDIIPHLKKRLQHYLPLKKHHVLLQDLDRVVKDCNEHRQEIFSKLVAIMRDRLDYHCKTMLRQDMNDSSVKGPSPYMLALTKETVTLQRVLSRILPQDQVKYVFTLVFDMYNKRLVSYWANLESLNPAGRKRLFGDIEYLIKTTKKLPGLEQVPGDALLLFFSARYGSL